MIYELIMKEIMKRLIFTILLIVVNFHAVASVWATESDWSGDWRFEECWQHISGEMNDCVFYKILITKNEEHRKEFTAKIIIDGYQSMQRIQAKGVARKAELEIRFESPMEDHRAPAYKPNDLLLTLKQESGSVTTEWHAIQPSLDENQKTQVYFKKERQGSPSSAPSQKSVIATFKEVSSKIKLGMKRKEVVSILGKPGTIEIPKDNAQLESLKAQEGLVYWHPEYATVHLLVGISGDSVSGTAMCRDVGSRVHHTACSSVTDYWKDENE